MKPLLALVAFLFDLLLWLIAVAELVLGIFLPLGHILFLLLSAITAVLAIVVLAIAILFLLMN
jgi:hypothetical protein